jgi:hypothetical protein
VAGSGADVLWSSFVFEGGIFGDVPFPPWPPISERCNSPLLFGRRAPSGLVGVGPVGCMSPVASVDWSSVGTFRILVVVNKRSRAR